tara:strand:- start:2689 stop:3672 length:984 start_codon:yes stop_codon:yes gene_type:complete
MSYSFFGTCFNDHYHLFQCLDTMINQSLEPKEIIIIDSGNENIEKKIISKLKKSDIKLIYIFRKLSRVESLNLGLDYSNHKYSLRFDSRSRFHKNYAKNAINILKKKSINAAVVGGAPSIIAEKENFESKICADIFSRDYIFFYPNHRKLNYTGYVSSVYLGCFNTFLIKSIKYRESYKMISEDSLIISDLNEKGYKTYISEDIKVSYVSRSSFINTLRLFNTYGFCRANTILISKKAFLSMRHFLIFLLLVMFFILIVFISLKILFLLPILLFIFNCLGEFFLIGLKKSFIIPFCATLCQISWISGFIRSFLIIFKKKSTMSNYIN